MRSRSAVFEITSPGSRKACTEPWLRGSGADSLIPAPICAYLAPAMASPKGNDPHAPHGKNDPHAKKGAHGAAHGNDHHADEEDVVKTPMWLPFVGLGLLVFGALASYLWIYPGTMVVSHNDGGDGGDASAEAAAPTTGTAQAQPAAPAPGH
jgi:hypothetical protein